jgi:predicted nucleotide-binding protein (sugar kinase/HSP70/actin superfamily)
MMKLAKAAVKTYFTMYAKAAGLHDYEIPNIEELSKLSKIYYPLDAEGGEGHLEVAHLLESVKHNLSHLVISALSQLSLHRNLRRRSSQLLLKGTNGSF